MTNGDVKVVFFGTAEFAVPILERLAQSPWRPMMVVSTPDAPAGRGQDIREPAVKTAAQAMGLAVIQPESLGAGAENLFPSGADIFIVAAYGKILPPELLKIPKYGSLGIHPSLLPRWRGASPVQNAILSGDAETGVTIILMDEAVDHGPILRNSKFQIPNSKITAPELTSQLAGLGAELLIRTIPQWVAGKIKAVPQDESQATFTKLLKREDGRIDWSEPAEAISRKIRAFRPWPGSYTLWRRGGGELRLTVESADVLSRSGEALGRPPGTAYEAEGRLAVTTGGEALLIRRLKPEGKKAMSGEEFLRGHRDIIGATLE